MGRKRHTPEQIIAKLREAEIELAKGQTALEVVRKLGSTEHPQSDRCGRRPDPSVGPGCPTDGG